MGGIQIPRHHALLEQREPESAGNGLGGEIVGKDARIQAVHAEFAEAVVPGCDSRLGGVSVPLGGRIEGPPDLDPRPVDADRVVEAFFP